MENLKENQNLKEGNVTKMIESQTAKIPSKVFLCAGLTALATAAALKMMGKKHSAIIVGQWAAPFLLFGIYDKIVKVEGHD